jgi:hypothetical protein
VFVLFKALKINTIMNLGTKIIHVWKVRTLLRKTFRIDVFGEFDAKKRTTYKTPRPTVLPLLPVYSLILECVYLAVVLQRPSFLS